MCQMTSSQPELRPAISKIDNEVDSLTVAWSDGEHSFYPSIYLRDNASSFKTANGQRLFETFELDDAATRIAAHELDETRDELRITWSDDEQSHFSMDWLFENSCNATHRARRHESAAATIQLWDAKSLTEPLSICSYDELVHGADDEQRIAVYAELRRHGVCLISDVPTRIRDQGEPPVIRVGNSLGHVRATNYGLHFDVRVERTRADNKEHLAYTTKGLSAHTDNPYRNPTPGVQLLHCLKQADNSASAGTSILIDGFKVANELRERYRADFELLSSIKRPFTYYDLASGYKFHKERFVIGVDSQGNVESVHYNNRSASSCHWDIDEREIEAYYRAWRRFGAMLHDADRTFAMEYRLEEGQIVIFDNNRVLHGRRGYELSAEAADGEAEVDTSRHLQGCYIDFDSVWGRLDGHEHLQKGWQWR